METLPKIIYLAEPKHLTPDDIKRRVGLSYRQIQYWRETRLIVPRFRRGNGHSIYDPENLCMFRIAKMLGDNGYSTQRIRMIIKKIINRMYKMDAKKVTVLLIGDEVVVAECTKLLASCGWLVFKMRDLMR